MASFQSPFGRIVAAVLCVLFSTASLQAHAQGAAARSASKAASSPGLTADPGNPQPSVSQPNYFDQGLLVRSGETVQALGPNLMGDLVNDYTGGLSFGQTDVSLPGNSALPVAVGRRLTTGTQQAALKIRLETRSAESSWTPRATR